jgi:hypothetical protein
MVAELEGRRALAAPTRRRGDIIKTDLGDSPVGREVVGRVQLDLDHIQNQAFVNCNEFLGSMKVGNFMTCRV